MASFEAQTLSFGDGRKIHCLKSKGTRPQDGLTPIVALHGLGG